jgi:hypothetical protein
MKLVFLIILLIRLPLSSICQEKHYGLSTGVSIGKWLGADELFAQSLANNMNQEAGFSDFTFKSSTRVGFSMGLFYDLPVKRGFSIQSELYYIQKGTRFSGTGTYTDYQDPYSVKSDMIWQLDYIDLVFLAKLTLSGSEIKPFLVAGPGIACLASARLKVKISGEGSADSESTKVDGFNKFDANLNFGGGLDFYNSIRLDIRYSMCLVPVFTNELNQGLKLRNSVTSVNLVAYF